ncbi:thioesterase family protein [Natrinema pallidum]|uniref:Acyl-CoA thioesterase n=1 Tax=Natrinema pallidum TaxID=69527 RepID=A0A4P9TGX3_9EURY|nr:thioesterase family protein [Natrinema pallidum]QCW04126.1 acyl-CoA thioesterase [Natrinema pallidum]
MSTEFTHEVPVRFRDLDPLDHVNHAVYASYLEAARTAYIEEVLGVPEADIAFVVATLELTYERPITYDDEPVVALAVAELGDSSCTMEYEIRVDGAVAATAETTIVHIDHETDEPTPIPPAIRRRLREYSDAEAPA